MTIYCINTVDRQDRKAHIKEQSWSQDVVFFDAIKAKHRHAVTKACTDSHRAIQNQHIEMGIPEDLLILEDDALIVDHGAYQKFLETPPTQITSLGSRPLASIPYFMYTQAMFIPWSALLQHGSLLHMNGNLEYIYHHTFGAINIFSPPIVIQSPNFISDRTGHSQSHYQFS